MYVFTGVCLFTGGGSSGPVLSWGGGPHVLSTVLSGGFLVLSWRNCPGPGEEGDPLVLSIVLSGVAPPQDRTMGAPFLPDRIRHRQYTSCGHEGGLSCFIL